MATISPLAIFPTRTVSAFQTRSTTRAAFKPSTTRTARLVVRAAADSDGPAGSSKALAVFAPVVGVAGSVALINAHVIDAPLLSYLNTVGVPVINALNPPEFVSHWFHGLNMGLVLFAMGGYGTYLGYRIRSGNGDEATFGTPDTAAELHWKLMAGMGFFFLLGGQGGLVLTLIQGRNILESPHAITAFAGLGVLAVQGVLGATMEDNATKRTIHAILGSSLMGLFLIHAALGLKLGLSF